MPIDWPVLRARLPTRLADVELGKFSRAPEDTFLSGAWRLDGRPVPVYLDCDPVTEDFEAAISDARKIRSRLAEAIGQARLFVALHIADLGKGDDARLEPQRADASDLVPGALWFYGDDTWSVHLKGNDDSLSAIFWGQSIVVEFAGDQPARATVED